MAAYIRDPVLVIWQAMKHLTGVRTKTDAPDVSTIVTEAETILFGLVVALARRQNGKKVTTTPLSIAH